MKDKVYQGPPSLSDLDERSWYSLLCPWAIDQDLQKFILNPKLGCPFFFFCLNSWAVTLETNSGFRASGKGLKSSSRTQGEISKAAWHCLLLTVHQRALKAQLLFVLLKSLT